MEQKISAIMVIYNEEKMIRRALESIKGVVDEILILHDGPCKDKSIEICKEYTDKVFIGKKNVGLPGPLLPILLRKAKGPWIIKLDGDEFLSTGMKKNLRKLTEDKEVDGYTFLWPVWDGKKYVTKKWPRKPSLYRKSKISYLGFPHFDDPRINGKVVATDYQLHHQPVRKRPPVNWRDFVERGIGKYGMLQAEWTIKNFEDLDKFQWNEAGYPRAIKIRRRFPVLSTLPMAFAAFFISLFKGGAWKEGRIALVGSSQLIIYYIWLGLRIRKLKNKQKKLKSLK